MIFEELVGLFVSYASTTEYESTSQENQQTQRETFWKDKIHQEYHREDGSELIQAECYDLVSHDDLVSYVSVRNEAQHIKRCFLESLRRSLRVQIGVLIAVIPLGLFAIGLAYFSLNTCNLCFEWGHHNNSVPIFVIRWNLIGEAIPSIPINIWFPLTLALLFGCKEFKSNHISTLYVGFAVGAAVLIYKTFLFVFGVFASNMPMFYRYPGNVLFLSGIICSSILVARMTHKLNPWTTYSKGYTIFMISFGVVVSFVITMFYKYLIVPYFNELEDGIHKAIVAVIFPAVALIPTAICKYLALRRSSEIIQPDRSFILVYFLRGTAICIYRLMQAEFQSLSLFVSLSLLHGISNVFSKATERLREKMWICFVACLKRTCCGRRLKLLPLNTPHYRRFKADIEIQNILFEYTTLILSQAHLVLYLITSFDISTWAVIKRSLIRMAIGLGIDFFFNCISIFIQIHYHNVPMRRVWLKCWKRHVMANAIILMLVVFYFAPIILTIFQARSDNSPQDYPIKNCTLPFRSW